MEGVKFPFETFQKARCVFCGDGRRFSSSSSSTVPTAPKIQSVALGVFVALRSQLPLVAVF